MSLEEKVISRVGQEIGRLREMSLERLVDELYKSGIRGVPSECGSCPVAMHFRKVVEGIDPTHTFVVQVQPCDIEVVQSNFTEKVIAQWQSPDCVMEFVAQFDFMGRMFTPFTPRQRNALRALVEDQAKNSDGTDYETLVQILAVIND